MNNINSVYINNKVDPKRKQHKKNIYCNNCGKYGHQYKKCNDPITSYGILTFKLDNLTDDEYKLINTLKNKYTITDKSTDIIRYNKKDIIQSTNKLDMMLFCILESRIKFLLIRRKHTLGYIEFVRGRYRVDNVEGIIFLFQQMTPQEIIKIENSNFDELWKDMWSETSLNQYRQHEYKISKENFERLKYSDDEENQYIGLKFYIENVKPTWSHAEWGIPKGRRNAQEHNLDCAKREYREETGLNDDDYVLLNIRTLEENIIGTNGKSYKHIYYLALDKSNKLPTINGEYKPQASEVGDIGWFTHQDALNLVRVHHVDRKKLLTDVYMFIVKNLSNIINEK